MSVVVTRMQDLAYEFSKKIGGTQTLVPLNFLAVGAPLCDGFVTIWYVSFL